MKKCNALLSGDKLLVGTNFDLVSVRTGQNDIVNEVCSENNETTQEIEI